MIHLKVLGIYRRVEDSPWAVCVGAVSETAGQDRFMHLSQLFELAAVDRNEEPHPAVL
jgi:hypothetical protein